MIIAELLPPLSKDRKMSSEFDEKRLLYNSLLKDFCFDINAEYVNFEQRSSDDGIHLNGYGIKINVKCVKKVLNPLLGVQTKLKQKMKVKKNENLNDRDFYDERGNKKYKHTNYRYGVNDSSIYSRYR